MSPLSERTARFRALHAEGHLLVLPNVWDAVSARLVEAAGAEAIATSSAALAWVHGCADGEHLPLDTLVTVVRTLTAAAKVPVTVDFERGYSDDPGAVAEAVARLADAGASGVNLEDREAPPEVLARKIKACKADPATAPLFINARIDAFLHGQLSDERALEESLARAHLFADAGADGIFVPKVRELPAIEALVRHTPLPLNVLAIPGLAPARDLAARGVRRLSAGPFLATTALAAAHHACRELLEHGTYSHLFDPDITVMGLNKLFAR